MGLLHSAGYTRVRYYPGGLEDWEAGGGVFERGAPAAHPSADPEGAPVPPPHLAAPDARRARPSGRRQVGDLLVDHLGNRSIGSLLGLWLGMTLLFGVVYWLSGTLFGHGLRAGDGMVGGGLDGLATSIYFSFVTALSIGYGDVVPDGWFRLMAIAEGAAGLIIFGSVISRLVSRRQEEQTAEIHRIAYEDRLGRVRTNLHLVLSDLQAISRMTGDGTATPERLLARLESTTAIFDAELETIHELLYRPETAPNEDVLEAILASLAADLGELLECLAGLPAGSGRSGSLRASLRHTSSLAAEICGECVPREYAPQLREWMNRIQEMAARLNPPEGDL